MRNPIIIPVLVVLLCSASLIKANNCDEFQTYPIRFAILGDRTGDHQEGMYTEVVVEVARMRPDFVMTVGDMIEGYTSDTVQMRTEWDEYLALVTPISAPIYYTPGNHDITSDMMEPSYLTRIGKPYYSFDHRGIHIVIIDNSRAESFSELPSTQIEWLKQDLASSTNACYTLVFMHKPFWYRTLGDNKPDPLHDIFKQNGVDAVFTGHFHTYFSGEFDGILYTSIGSSGAETEEIPEGLLYHFGWVTIDGDGIHIAPIKKDAVLPWDIQPVQEYRLASQVKSNALRFMSTLKVDDGMKAVNDKIIVTIDCGLPGLVYNNILKWNLPEGWKIEPEEFPYSINCVSTVSLPFTVTAPENLFPLPQATTDLPYASGKTVPVSRPLELTRSVTCVKSDEVVTIDGVLTESAWEKPCEILFENNGTLSEQDPTQIYFAYDNNNLYLAARCSDPKIDSLKAEMTARDADVFLEDAVGFMLWPGGAGGDAYQMYINPLGTIYDQHIERQSDGYWTSFPEWNGEYEAKTTRDEETYTVEIRVPLAQFKLTPESGDTWRVNFRRKQFRTATAAAFQIPWSYDPRTYGELKFE